MDGSSNKIGEGAGSGSIKIEQLLNFNFKASNNQAEYEASVEGILLAKDTEARKLKC